MSELFARPEALPLLLLAPAAWLLLRLHDRARARRLDAVAGPRAAALGAVPRPGPWLFAAVLLLALLAVLDPAWGESGGGAEPLGIDLVLCLDVSRSMLARDLAPDRLGRAREEIRALAERARGDRLGLVVFAGEARALVPLTQDMASFAELAARADPLAVGRGGTDLGAALEAALGLLAGGTGEHEAIVLLTDGEDLGGKGLAAARACRERGIAVHCLGLGTTLGSKIAMEGAGFLKDRAGREVVSAMDARSLARIAESTGGAFTDARQGSLAGIYEERILPMARKAFEAGERRQRERRFQWPLAAAVLLGFVELRRRP